MKNYVQPGGAIDVTAPYAVNAGGGMLIGSGLFGIAVDTMASGATGPIWTDGVFDITKNTGAGESYVAGQRVFWDNTNKRLTSTSTGNLNVGVTVATAATGDATARVVIDGGPALPLGT